MRIIIIALLAALILAGCGTTRMQDGYQLGDITGSIADAQIQYCATSDPYQRAIALALLHRLSADVPDRGACSDLAALLPEVEVPDVDVEAAEQDRKWFEEMRDAGQDSEAAADAEGTE